jgi:hypothetical protein
LLEGYCRSNRVPLRLGPALYEEGFSVSSRFKVNYSHFLIRVRFVLASVAHLKEESDADSHTVALISAGVRLELNHGSRSVPVSAAET